MGDREILHWLDDAEDFYDYMYNEDLNKDTYIWTDCILPSLSSIQFFLLKLILINLLFGVIVTTRKLSEDLLHILSGLIGVYFIFNLEYFLGKVIILTFVGVSYCLVLFKCFVDARYRQLKHFKYFNSSNILKCVTIIVLVLCQYILLELKTWMEIRGVIMIFTMKFISLVDDIDSFVISHLSCVQYFGYMCCGSNILFGPWICYKDYSLLLKTPTVKSKWWIFAVAKTLLKSIIFLIFSNCILDYLIPEESNSWLIAYKEAVSFRTSHYFISFLSEASMLAAGYKNFRYWYSNKWQYVVTTPSEIEFPTALATVFINWNKPMHDFLRKYVYRSWVQFGKFYGILATFIVSSFLHGFELKVSVVLITVGIFSFVQNTLRNHLSDIFSLCIKIYPCRDRCKHKYKRDHNVSILLKIIFSLSSMLHLVFLGRLMDSSTDDVGILQKWSDMKFISFWIITFKTLFIL